MLVAKILFNSVISTPETQFMTMDKSNFYLMTPLFRPEYIQVKLMDLPDKIINKYKIQDQANRKRSIFLKVVKGIKIVPSLWKHKTRLIQFALMVDDFGVKYAGREHAEHRKRILKEHYKVTADWTGEQYMGIHLKWDYKKRQCHLYMPVYVKMALIQFGHLFKQTKTTKSTVLSHTNQVWSHKTICQ
ncbi:hypothetical protein ACHAW6_006797 [Cyclotella cf. meneghiniana]